MKSFFPFCIFPFYIFLFSISFIYCISPRSSSPSSLSPLSSPFSSESSTVPPCSSLPSLSSASKSRPELSDYSTFIYYSTTSDEPYINELLLQLYHSLSIQYGPFQFTFSSGKNFNYKNENYYQYYNHSQLLLSYLLKSNNELNSNLSTPTTINLAKQLHSLHSSLTSLQSLLPQHIKYAHQNNIYHNPYININNQSYDHTFYPTITYYDIQLISSPLELLICPELYYRQYYSYLCMKSLHRSQYNHDCNCLSYYTYSPNKYIQIYSIDYHILSFNTTHSLYQQMWHWLIEERKASNALFHFITIFDGVDDYSKLLHEPNIQAYHFLLNYHWDGIFSNSMHLNMMPEFVKKKNPSISNNPLTFESKDRIPLVINSENFYYHDYQHNPWPYHYDAITHYHNHPGMMLAIMAYNRIKEKYEINFCYYTIEKSRKSQLLDEFKIIQQNHENFYKRKNLYATGPPVTIPIATTTFSTLSNTNIQILPTTSTLTVIGQQSISNSPLWSWFTIFMLCIGILILIVTFVYFNKWLCQNHDS